MAKKKYYGGYLLPDIEPLWDRLKYPFAYISVDDCEKIGSVLGYSWKGKRAALKFVNTTGYIKTDATTGLNSYVAHSSSLEAIGFVIALDDDAAESLSELYPGINKETWVAGTTTMGEATAADSGPHWTNVNLLDSTNKMFLTATAPVDYFDLASWLTGYTLGRTGRPLPFMTEQGTFTGCRYGDLTLPYELTWDKEKLPYVLMLYFPDNNLTVAWATNRKLHRLSESTGYGLLDDVTAAKFSSSRGRIREKDGTFCDPVNWESPMHNVYGLGTFETNELIWANYDIYTVGGSLYYTAAPPVKIYEQEE